MTGPLAVPGGSGAIVLVEFLRARLGEDAEAARDATAGPWAAEHPEGSWGDDPEARLVGGGKIIGSLSNDYNGHLNADHIARHDPARVLADVEAKRQIMAEHEMVPTSTRADGDSGCEICAPVYSWGKEIEAGPCRTLLLLALPYSGHPDYREGWKP
ncbi:DUF6221 family protein [Streptomyces sp. NPDC001635]